MLRDLRRLLPQPAPQPLLPFTCLALHCDDPPIRIGLLARSKSDAILTAKELFPDHTLGVVELSPEW